MSIWKKLFSAGSYTGESMPTTKFKFECPSCKTKVTGEDDLCGQSVQCPFCRATIVVPPRGNHGVTRKKFKIRFWDRQKCEEHKRNPEDVMWITSESDRRKMQTEAEKEYHLALAIMNSDANAVKLLLQGGSLGSVKDLPMSKVRSLLEELVAIANRDGHFVNSGHPSAGFDQDGHHIRARQIGEELYRLGGGVEPRLMRSSYYYVEATCGHILARELSFAWHGVGENAWLA